MWLGQQTVSSFERFPIFKVSFIDRFHCYLISPFLTLTHCFLYAPTVTTVPGWRRVLMEGQMVCSEERRGRPGRVD